MADTVSYVKKSISKIGSDTIISQAGTVTVNSDKSVTLSKLSNCTFEYNYKSSVLKAQYMKLTYKVVDSTATYISRYNNNLRINLIIDYYEETFDSNGTSTGFIDGVRQYIRAYPYLQHEKEGYIGKLQIPIQEESYVKKITMTLEYMSGSVDSVTFMYVNLYNSRTTSEVIQDTYGFSIQADHADICSDGIELYFKGDSAPTVLQFIDNGSGGLGGVRINPGKDSESVFSISHLDRTVTTS